MTEASLSDPPRPDLEQHPDWVCREPRSEPGTPGDPIEHKTRGTYLDITGGYREVVLTRLRELAESGADGFNFDERHLPPDGCWGSALEAAWIAEKGVDAPTKESDPRYLEFLDFKARKIEDTFLFWRDRVKAEYPNVVFAVSTAIFSETATRWTSAGALRSLTELGKAARNPVGDRSGW